MAEFNIDKQRYENNFQIRDKKCFQLCIRRPIDSFFVNNYFDIRLRAREAISDIQAVFNFYKVVTYIFSYFSKDEDKWCQDMIKVIKEAIESGASYYEQINSVAHLYGSKRECSLQKAMYNVIPELWLRKIFPVVVNAKQ